jgi:hypothetical protein
MYRLLLRIKKSRTHILEGKEGYFHQPQTRSGINEEKINVAAVGNRAQVFGTVRIFFISSKVFTAATMKNGVFWEVAPCGSCKNDVSEEPGASFIRVTRIGALGTTLAVTSNRLTLRRNTKSWYFQAS